MVIPRRPNLATIALKLGDASVVVREADVVRTEKRGSLYQIWTRSDANVIVRLESVAKASGKPRPCECGHASTEKNADIIIEIPPMKIPDVNCEPRYICFTVWGHEFCSLYYVCTVGPPFPP